MVYDLNIHQSGTGLYWWGLVFSNTLGSNIMSFLLRNDTSFLHGIDNTLGFLVLGYSDSTNLGVTWTHASVKIYAERIIATAHAQFYNTTYGNLTLASIQTRATTAYWLGVYYTGAGYPSAHTYITRVY